MKVIAYLHASKENMRGHGEKAGLTGAALDLFSYACHEVEVTLDVGADGNATITHVDGRAVAAEKG